MLFKGSGASFFTPCNLLYSFCLPCPNSQGFFLVPPSISAVPILSCSDLLPGFSPGAAPESCFLPSPSSSVLMAFFSWHPRRRCEKTLFFLFFSSGSPLAVFPLFGVMTAPPKPNSDLLRHHGTGPPYAAVLTVPFCFGCPYLGSPLSRRSGFEQLFHNISVRHLKVTLVSKPERTP